MNIVVIDTTGQYNPSPGVTALRFTMVGGGGGGGGISGQGVGTACAGSCGAAGETSIIISDNPASSYSITIGNGGAGGAGAGGDGSTGGKTQIIGDIFQDAEGGQGGLGMVGTSGHDFTNPVFGGTGGTGDLRIEGGQGSLAIVDGGEVMQYSVAGQNIFGGAMTSFGNARDAESWGSGGGSAVSSGVSGDLSGGDGHQGVVIVEEYFFT